MDNIDRVVFSDEDQKNHIKGEAYAMRGLAYLQFAWCWGGSPLITTDLSLAELRKVKRSSQEETYQQAIKDFELAYDLLPEKEAVQKWDVLPNMQWPVCWDVLTCICIILQRQ